VYPARPRTVLSQLLVVRQRVDAVHCGPAIHPSRSRNGLGLGHVKVPLSNYEEVMGGQVAGEVSECHLVGSCMDDGAAGHCRRVESQIGE
jgi:hypothetical protein